MVFKKIYLLIIFSLNTLFGHAIWIETNSAGKNGQKHEVKIFLGEYAQNERDSTHKWFSNMRDFKLWLIAPNGEKTQLSCESSGDHFKTCFIPSISGTYILKIDHIVTEIYGESKIHYYALGIVSVNETKQQIDLDFGKCDFILRTDSKTKHRIHKELEVELLYKNSIVLEGNVTVQSPEGWTKNFKINQSGKVQFLPYWTGQYLLEGTITEVEGGLHEGKEYKRTWHCVTYCIQIAK